MLSFVIGFVCFCYFTGRWFCVLRRFSQRVDSYAAVQRSAVVGVQSIANFSFALLFFVAALLVLRDRQIAANDLEGKIPRAALLSVISDQVGCVCICARACVMLLVVGPRSLRRRWMHCFCNRQPPIKQGQHCRSLSVTSSLRQFCFCAYSLVVLGDCQLVFFSQSRY